MNRPVLTAAQLVQGLTLRTDEVALVSYVYGTCRGKCKVTREASGDTFIKCPRCGAGRVRALYASPNNRGLVCIDCLQKAKKSGILAGED